MILHLGFELPKPPDTTLDHESSSLTQEEVRILKDQIRKNSSLIQLYIERLDLLVNKEKIPSKELFLDKIRKRLTVLMEENDTFRSVLWDNERKLYPRDIAV